MSCVFAAVPAPGRRARPRWPWIVALLCLVAPRLSRSDEPPRPNIILILADDLGYECLRSDGGESYATPALDRLASEGVRFEHCYAQPLCTPTRVQLLTGLYNQRNYIRFGLLDPAAITVAHLLRRAGYRTCVAGKWQLGGGADAPARFGFEEHLLWQLTVRKSRYPNPVLERDGKVLEHKRGEYGPDVVSDFVVDFLRRHRDEPFFVFYPMILAHWPFEPTPASPEWDPKAEGVLKGQGDPRHFGDMVAYTDRLVGKVARVVDELGLAERTLIIFVGDNGTAEGLRSRFRGSDFVGGKGRTTDAGTHVPLIVRWPGRARAGAVSSALVDATDFLPTILDAASTPHPPGLRLDGVSLQAELAHPGAGKRDWVYSWYSRDGGPVGVESARDRRFRLYADGRLFDVTKDPLEQRALPAEGLEPEAKAAMGRLAAAIARFGGTRTIPPEYELAADQVSSSPIDPWRARARLEALGGRVLSTHGRVEELDLNRSQVDDVALRLVAAFPDLTDLSLEETRVSDAGARLLAQIASRGRLQWLNLYRTRVGDAGLEELSSIESLRHLPIGETRVSDTGLASLAKLEQLEYLGLRGNAITDAGLEPISRISGLKALNLAETQVTDAGIRRLRPLRKLEKLWLWRTAVTDGAIEDLAILSTLRELHVTGTGLTEAGLTRLRAALPECEVSTEE